MIVFSLLFFGGGVKKVAAPHGGKRLCAGWSVRMASQGRRRSENGWDRRRPCSGRTAPSVHAARRTVGPSEDHP